MDSSYQKAQNIIQLPFELNCWQFLFCFGFSQNITKDIDGDGAGDGGGSLVFPSSILYLMDNNYEDAFVTARSRANGMRN